MKTDCEFIVFIYCHTNIHVLIKFEFVDEQKDNLPWGGKELNEWQPHKQNKSN